MKKLIALLLCVMCFTTVKAQYNVVHDPATCRITIEYSSNDVIQLMFLTDEIRYADRASSQLLLWDTKNSWTVKYTELDNYLDFDALKLDLDAWIAGCR